MMQVEIQRARDAFERVLGEPIIGFEEPETGKFNLAYRIETQSGKRYVARIAPEPEVPVLFYERDMMLQEPQVLRLVREKTKVPVADVAWFEESSEFFGRPMIIQTVLPGEPMSHAHLADPHEMFRQLGSMVRGLHDGVQGVRFGYLGPHEPMKPQPRWSGAFRVMWRKLLKDIAEARMYDPTEVEIYRRLLECRLDHFDRAIPASLLHMDLWQENILTDGRAITGIIDWDRAVWGDPEMELVILEKSGFLTDDFWAGYGPPPRRDELFMIRRAFYILYEHQKHIFIYSTRDRDLQAAEEHREECRRLLGKIAGGEFDFQFINRRPE